MNSADIETALTPTIPEETLAGLQALSDRWAKRTQCEACKETWEKTHTEGLNLQDYPLLTISSSDERAQKLATNPESFFAGVPEWIRNAYRVLRFFYETEHKRFDREAVDREFLQDLESTLLRARVT